MKLAFLLVAAFFCSVSGAFAASRHETERLEVKRLLADDFAALNKGEKSLVEVAERAVTLAGATALELRRRILLDGAIRLLIRAGETDRADEVRRQLEAILDPFAASGREAVLRLGKYGALEFAKCPTGTVDVAVDWRSGKTVRVTLTKPYWIMKYPLTRRESALFPPLDPPPGVVDDEIFANYVCLNRSQAEGLSEYFTRHFRDALPEGYVVRLPTLAEWEHAFHAGTQDPENPFFDLLHIHMNDEVDKTVRYDYDRNDLRRKKLANDWGIGDWCGQEKVLDIVDPSQLRKSDKDGGDVFQVQALPRFETTIDPCFQSVASNRMSLVRMPFWARWKATRIGKGDDWCPIRLVIGPKIAE